MTISQGLELRKKNAREPVEPLPEVIGKPELDMTKLRKLGRLHHVPKAALLPVEAVRAYVRKGRGSTPLAVCRPPHVIVSGDRRFAVYSNKFIVIPNPQIGIAGGSQNRDNLKLLALYLSSSFCQYYEFYRSPQGGIREGRSSLDVLKKLPVPLDGLSNKTRLLWLRLHDQLSGVTTSADGAQDLPHAFTLSATPEAPGEMPDRQQALVDELVGEALGLTKEERFLVDDLVRIRIPLVDGKVAGPGIRPPTEDELHDYSTTLERALNAFTGESSDAQHHITVVVSTDVGGVAEIALVQPSGNRHAVVRQADVSEKERLKRIFSQLSAKHAQWLYFDRNLLVHDESRSYLLKPAQLLWWSRSQALADADELIGACLTAPLS
jgi:hypothetical protein